MNVLFWIFISTHSTYVYILIFIIYFIYNNFFNFLLKCFYFWNIFSWDFSWLYLYFCCCYLERINELNWYHSFICSYQYLHGYLVTPFVKNSVEAEYVYFQWSPAYIVLVLMLLTLFYTVRVSLAFSLLLFYSWPKVWMFL